MIYINNMKQRIFIVHQWSSSPEDDWYPWLKKELENKGYEVVVPEMPEADEPEIEKWVPALVEVIGEIEQTDILIGHSIGCQTILRFLETLSENQKVAKVIMVAPWMILADVVMEDEEDQAIAKPWIETPIDFEKVKTKANKFIAIFSDNDLFVSLDDNRKIFEQKLGAKILIESSKGHFTEDDGITELPIVLNLIY